MEGGPRFGDKGVSLHSLRCAFGAYVWDMSDENQGMFVEKMRDRVSVRERGSGSVAESRWILVFYKLLLMIRSIIHIQNFHEKFWWRPRAYYDEKVRLIKVSHATLTASVEIDSLAVICKAAQYLFCPQDFFVFFGWLYSNAQGNIVVPGCSKKGNGRSTCHLCPPQKTKKKKKYNKKYFIDLMPFWSKKKF